MHILKMFALERKNLFIRVAALSIVLLLAVLLLSQTVFAETTYVITDGSRILVYTTTATDPETILDEAGLALGADDTYTIQANDGSSEITVQRSQTITLNHYGKEMEVTSLGETVEELLTRLNLPWGEDDVISAALDQETFDGMELTVSSVIQKEQVYTGTVPYETVYRDDAALPAGETALVTEGVNGTSTCTALVTYINGEETERTLLSEKVTIQPVSEVIAIGTGESVTASSLPVIDENTITLPTGEVLPYTKVITSLATAYCDKGLTATGTQARVGAIAVDPRRIPYGSRLFIMSTDGEYIYGVATAEDTGSREHIVGTRIDLHFDTRRECIQFGARDCLVYFLG